MYKIMKNVDQDFKETKGKHHEIASFVYTVVHNKKADFPLSHASFTSFQSCVKLRWAKQLLFHNTDITMVRILILVEWQHCQN